MDKAEYQNKLLQLLEDKSTFTPVHSSQNTNLKDAVSTLVQNWKSKGFLTSSQAKHLRIVFPQPPHIHSLP